MWLLLRQYIRLALLSFVLMLFQHKAHAIVISVENKFSENEKGALVEVSDIKGKGIRPCQKVFIMPGKTEKISSRVVNSFTIARVYGDYKQRYIITCQENRRKEIVTINFQDVANGVLPTGCSISKQGKWTAEKGNTWKGDDIEEIDYLKIRFTNGI